MSYEHHSFLSALCSLPPAAFALELNLTTMSFTSVICSVLLTGYMHAQEDCRILEAIALQETAGAKNDYAKIGDRGRARGRYGIHRAAWVDGSMQLMREKREHYSFDEWNRPVAQDATALAIIRSIRERLKANGIKPTPARIALVWNRGFNKALLTDFRLNGYAHRVQNLYDSRDFQPQKRTEPAKRTDPANPARPTKTSTNRNTETETK